MSAAHAHTHPTGGAHRLPVQGEALPGGDQGPVPQRHELDADGRVARAAGGGAAVEAHGVPGHRHDRIRDDRDVAGRG